MLGKMRSSPNAWAGSRLGWMVMFILPGRERDVNGRVRFWKRGFSSFSDVYRLS